LPLQTKKRVKIREESQSFYNIRELELKKNEILARHTNYYYICIVNDDGGGLRSPSFSYNTKKHHIIPQNIYNLYD
jgi:hypothetical protein